MSKGWDWNSFLQTDPMSADPSLVPSTFGRQLLAVDDATGALNLIGAEPALGNPAGDGYVLVSTAAGVRSWAATPSLPSQGGHSGEFLTTNGTSASWATITAPVWGAITGTLSSQTDLQAALDAKQASDADLTAIAALTASNDDFLQRKAGAWTNRTLAQVKSDLSLSGTNTGDQDLSGYQTKAGVLALGGFSSITGRIARTNLPTDFESQTMGLFLGFIVSGASDPKMNGLYIAGDFEGSTTAKTRYHSMVWDFDTGDWYSGFLWDSGNSSWFFERSGGLSHAISTQDVPEPWNVTNWDAGTEADDSATLAVTDIDLRQYDGYSGLILTANQSLRRNSGNTAYEAFRAQEYDADLTTWAGITPGTGVGTALATNVGSAGAFVTFNGALGTPSSGSAANLTSFPTLNQNTTGSAASLSISGQTGLLTFTGLTSTNRAKTVRDAADTILELGGSYTPTGTWTNMTMVTPTLGVASGTTLSLSGAVGSSAITVSGVTQTTNQPVLNLAQTWNASGIAFAGIKLNVTNTASASGSMLMQLQTGSSNQFTISTFGTARGNVFGAGGFYAYSDQASALADTTANRNAVIDGASSGGFKLRPLWQVGWTSGDAAGSFRTALGENSAGVVEINNGTAGTYRDLRLRSLYSGSADIHADVTNTINTNGFFVAGDPSTQGTFGIVAYGNNAFAESFDAFKTRAATTAASTIVQNGDAIFTINARASAGNNTYKTAASISFEVDGSPSTTSMPGRILFKTTPSGSVTPVTNLTIDAAGLLTSNGEIFNQRAAKPTLGSNQGAIYAKDVGGTAEVFVEDEAGNETQISPHDEAGHWVFRSENSRTGRGLRIEAEKLMRFLNSYFGKDFVHDYEVAA